MADQSGGAVSPQGQQGLRLPALTGLRIFAALAVYGSHIGAPHESPETLKTFLASGYCGVTIFFVLSGFVLAINYFEDLRHPRPAGIFDYFVARFARVYPLYALVLLFVIVSQSAAGQDHTGWWEHVFAVQAWDSNLEHVYDFNAPAWSVSTEFFLYACFPLLVPLIARLRRPRGMLVLAAAVAATMVGLAAWFVISGNSALPFNDPESAHRWLYRTPLTRLGDFTLGILAARLYVETRHMKSVKRLGQPLALAAGGVIVAFMSWQALLTSVWSWDVAYGVPAAILIFGLAVAPKSLPARALSLGPVVLLGEASYAFYLIHAPISPLFGAAQWATEVSPSLIVYELLTLGALLAFAVGLHTTFERPVRSYLRRVLSLRPRRYSPQ